MKGNFVPITDISDSGGDFFLTDGCVYRKRIYPG